MITYGSFQNILNYLYVILCLISLIIFCLMSRPTFYSKNDTQTPSDMKLNFKKVPIPLHLQIKSLKQAIIDEIPSHSFNNSSSNLHSSFLLSGFEIDSIKLISSTSSFEELTLRSEDEFLSSTSPFLLLKIQVRIRSRGILGLFNHSTKYKLLASYSMVMQTFEHIYYYPELFARPIKTDEKSVLTSQIEMYIHNLNFSNSEINIISAEKYISVQNAINSEFSDPDKFKHLTLSLGDIQFFFPKTSSLISDSYYGLAFGCSTSFCSNYSEILGEGSIEYPPIFKALSYSSTSKQHNKSIKAYFAKDLKQRGIKKEYITDCVVFDPEYACKLKDTIKPVAVPRSALICRKTSELSSFCSHHSFGYTSVYLNGVFYHEIVLSLAKHYADVFCVKQSVSKDTSKDFIVSLYILIFEQLVLKKTKIALEQSVLMYKIFSTFITNKKPFDLQRNSNITPDLIGYPSCKLTFSYSYSNIGEDLLEPSQSDFNIQFDELFERVLPFINFILPNYSDNAIARNLRSQNPERILKSILKFMIHN